MKTLFKIALLAVAILLPVQGWTADTKISAMTPKGTPVAADTTVIVDSVGGANKNITLGSIAPSVIGALPTIGGTITGDLTFNPGNLTFTGLAAPTAPTLAAGVAGLVTNGTHYVAVTFLTASGETLAGTPSTVITITSNDKISVSAIPTGPAGTTGRNIYMTTNGTANTGPFYLVSNGGPTLANNTATTYTINVADATLGTGNYVASPWYNTTSGVFSQLLLSPGSRTAPSLLFLDATGNYYGFYESNDGIHFSNNGTSDFAIRYNGLLLNWNTATYLKDGAYGQLLVGTTAGGTDGSVTTGSLGLTVAASTCTLTLHTTSVNTVVNNAAVTASSQIFLFPTNSAAALSTLQPYISAKSAGSSFTVTAIGAAGTETFNYLIVN